VWGPTQIFSKIDLQNFFANLEKNPSDKKNREKFFSSFFEKWIRLIFCQMTLPTME